MDGNVTMNLVKKLGWQVYLTNPYEHMYEKLEDMPKANYLNQVQISHRLVLQINKLKSQSFADIIKFLLNSCNISVISDICWSCSLGNHNKHRQR